MLWAEDGDVFLTQAAEPDSPWIFFRPYAGYLHFVPRVLADVVVKFYPADDWAITITALSCFTVAVVALITFHCSAFITSNVAVRAGWALIPIAVNVGAIQTLGNFANIHWYLLWLAPWLLLKPTISRIEGGVLFVVAASTSLTEIITALFVPLFFYRLRDRSFWPARAGLLVGLICQAVTTLSHPRGGNDNEPVPPLSAMFGWILNTAGPIVHGDSRSFAAQILHFGAGPIVLSAVLLFVPTALIAWRGAVKDRWVAGLLVMASVVVWAACVVANPDAYFDYASFDGAEWSTNFWYSRYAVVPTMFMLATIPLTALVVGRKTARGGSAVLLGFGVLLASMYFPAYTDRDPGPSWTDELQEARAECAAGGDPVSLTAAPSYYQRDAMIPCSYLVRLDAEQ